MFIQLFIDVCYLASGVFWITDTEVGLLGPADGFAGDVAMSLVECFKWSDANKKRDFFIRHF